MTEWNSLYNNCLFMSLIFIENTIFFRSGNKTVRNGDLDAIFLGLFVEAKHRSEIVEVIHCFINFRPHFLNSLSCLKLWAHYTLLVSNFELTATATAGIRILDTSLFLNVLSMLPPCLLIIDVTCFSSISYCKISEIGLY